MKTDLETIEFKEILKQYSIDGFEKSEELYSGISNKNYKIYTSNIDKTYLLKVFQDKNLPALEQEYLILSHLKTHDYPYIVLPFTAENGKPYFQYKNIFGTLTEFLPAAPPAESDDVCFKIGKALAELHLIKPNPNLRQHSEVGYPPIAVTNFMDNPKCPDDYKETVSLLLTDSLKNFFEMDFPEGIIHGDLFISNALFSHGELKAIIDFEQAGLDKFIFDIGITITGICVLDGKVDNSLKSSFLKGYEIVRPLTSNENAYLNESIIFGFLTMALWRIHKYEIKKLKAELADHYKLQLQKAKDFHESL